MRFLHTSDWHLGRLFFGVHLTEDQAGVLDQLVLLVREAKIDCVLLAGDVYDRALPPPDAVRLLDDIVTRLVIEAGTAVVMIAGNHDSAERLGFGARVLEAGGLHVAGTRPLALTLADASGSIDVVAVPYAEPAVVRARLGDDTLVDHEKALVAELDRMAAGLEPGRRRVVLAHAFVTGAVESESERPLVVGGSASVAARCFDGFDYVALGHLHRPQTVARSVVRYSGSLLKYSFAEADHAKSVTIVEVDERGVCRTEDIALSPRRDVRVLRGTLEELQRGAATDSARDDYILAELTDRGAILDAIGKLRRCYPNCLHIDRTSFFDAPGAEQATRADHRRHTEAELFGSFFREVTGGEPNAEETLAFAEVVARVRGADATGANGTARAGSGDDNAQ
ncbi:MAG: exonuclease SbcCD subunit D [Deltaproteobacteria bacterium]|nr:exonuclease SbcCD subunit D [Deltaproteobacteria bacterium]